MGWAKKDAPYCWPGFCHNYRTGPFTDPFPDFGAMQSGTRRDIFEAEVARLQRWGILGGMVPGASLQAVI